MIVTVAILIWLICVTVNDLLDYKISNRLILLGMIFGFGYRFYQEGIMAIVFFPIDFILPILLLFLLFSFRVLGAGDIKVFAVLSGIYGLQITLVLIILSFLYSSILVIIQFLHNNSLISKFLKTISIPLIRVRIFFYGNDIISNFGKQGSLIHFSLAITIAYISILLH